MKSFRGPAPLHHTLLANRTRTGVTLQTLHNKHFDRGLIVKQTEFDIPNPESCTVPELLDVVSARGAQMLVDGIRSADVLFNVHHPPLLLDPTNSNVDDLIYARKISSEDRHVDWAAWSWPEIRKRCRILGPLWSMATTCLNNNNRSSSFSQKRVIFTSMDKVEFHQQHDYEELPPGQPFIVERNSTTKELYVFAQDGTLIHIHQMKVEGEQAAVGSTAALKARMVDHGSLHFHKPLE